MSTIFDTISIDIKFDTNIISKEKKLETLFFSVLQMFYLY